MSVSSRTGRVLFAGGVLTVGLILVPTSASANRMEQICGYDLQRNGLDDDGINGVDDPGEGSFNTCTDGVNNDPGFDTLIDSADPDCGFEYCCQDGIDNDGDGLADAADTDCGCLNDVVGPQNCTANDVEVVLVGYGTPSDPCINSSDTTSIELQAQIGSQGGNTRYDVQLWFGLTGSAQSGTCARQILQPVVTAGTTPTTTQLNNGCGPFRNDDGTNTDICGEIRGSDNVTPATGSLGQPDAVYQVPLTLTLNCSDVGVNQNGFLDIPTCFSYEQNSDGGCTDPNGALDFPSSKCRCEEASATQVSVPNINCGTNFIDNGVTTDDFDNGEIACVEFAAGNDPAQFGNGQFDPGETARCTVTYQNDTICTVNTANDPDRRCGTGSYFRFRITPSTTTRGDFVAVSVSDNDTATLVNSDEILWTPLAPAGFGGSGGIISPNGNSEELTFDYMVDPAATGVQNVTFTMATHWSFTSDFAGETLQPGLACSATITTTPVSLAFFRSEGDRGRAVVEWSTATETANAGFNVYGRTEGGWVRLNDELIPSQVVSSTAPQSYRLEVEGDYDAFRVEDVDLRGHSRRHEAFAAGESFGERPAPEWIDWADVQAQNRPAAGPRRAVAAGKGGGSGNASNGSAGNGGASSGPVALRVREDGVYRVTFEDLAAAGFDLSKALPGDLLLENRGQGVPIRVVAGKKFGPGSYLEFWGEGLDTVYTDTNVYLLSAAKGAGLRIAEDATSPAGTPPASYPEALVVERNRTYSVNAPGGDPWVDQVLLATNARQFNYPLTVQGLAGTGPANLDIELGGVTDWPTPNDHHVRVSLNGTQVADEYFDGAVPHTISVPLPPGLLVEGANTLTLALPVDTPAAWDAMVVESYGTTYPRGPVARDGGLVFEGAAGVWTVSGLGAGQGAVYRLDAGGPVHLSGAVIAASGGGYAATFPGRAAGGRYVVADSTAIRTPEISAARTPSDLLAGEAKYLIVTHPSFAAGLDPLIAARRLDGYTVGLVDVLDVYAAYSGEVVDADAVRRFLADAVAERGTQYVLLVGGDTYDYRNYSGGGSISFVPSLYAATGSGIQWAPADPAYVDLDRDGVPDLPIGRFPVRTAAELGYMVDKTLAYEDRGYERSALLIADRFDGNAGISFQGESNQFHTGLVGGWTPQRAYLDQDTVAVAKQKILDGVNAGVPLTGFFGHSGPTVWTFSGLFRSSDVASLTNVGSPTVVMQWGCWNTYYVEPAYNTLGHRWLVAGEHGAAAVLGATTLVDDRSSRILSRHLAPAASQVGVPLGLALTEAKRRVEGERRGLADVQLGWTLLGDPALVLYP